MTKAEAFAEYEALTDINHHTSALIALTGCMKSRKLADAYVTILTEIDCEHELIGHLPTELRVLRDGLGRQVIKYARLAE